MEVSPKFTVITICYNAEKTIQSTIESVNDQSVKSIQHLIIDGASSDRTLNICEKYKHKNTLIISEPDDGIYFAMNKGLAAARGEIVCFLNADDFYVSVDVLEKVEATFNVNPELNYCYGDICYVEAGDREKIVRYWKSKENAAEALKRGWIPPHPAFFIRNKLLKEVGNFNLKYKFAADFDFILRCLLSKYGQGKYIPSAMVNMRVGGLTNKNFRNVILQNIEILRILRAHNLKFSRLMFMFNKFIIRLKQRWDVLR